MTGEKPPTCYEKPVLFYRVAPGTGSKEGTGLGFKAASCLGLFTRIDLDMFDGHQGTLNNSK